jgi:hypothetical protein
VAGWRKIRVGMGVDYDKPHGVTTKMSKWDKRKRNGTVSKSLIAPNTIFLIKRIY